MKLALIPPFAYLGDTNKTDYQLMLPHLIENTAYSYQYEMLGADPNQFVILDNGVAEGEQIDWYDIQDIAASYNADEVVLPDVMGSMYGTQESVADALLTWRRPKGVGLMYVLQGQTSAEIEISFRDACQYKSVTTIGIPRHLPTTFGIPDIRWRIVNWIMHTQLQRLQDRKIHFLGMNSAFPLEMEYYGERHSLQRRMIRGFDTSAPYNFAYFGKHMANGVDICSRPDGYFEKDAALFHATSLVSNIAYLKRCAAR